MRPVHFYTNRHEFFVAHFSAVEAALREGGHATAVHVPGVSAAKELHGKPALIDFPFRRTSRSPASLLRLVRLVRAEVRREPDALRVFVTLAPILVGAVATAFTRASRVLYFTGLGTAFSSPRTRHRLLRAVIVAVLYMSARSSRTFVIVQNSDDLATIRRLAKVPIRRSFLIKGCGVAREAFPFFEEYPPCGPKAVLVPARLIREKGIREAARASRILDGRGVEHELWLSADIDPGNPLSLSREELSAIGRDCRRVRFLGSPASLQPFLRDCHVVCLPTYREGLPTAVVEAMACGRPVVTTDAPGCRDAVRHGVDGLLVRPRSGRAVADAVQRLLEDHVLCERLRQAARRRYEQEFTKEANTAVTLECLARVGRAGDRENREKEGE